MERSFILFSFLFLIFPPYDLIAFMLANLSRSFQRADKCMRKVYKSVTKWRGKLSLFKHLNRLVKNITSHLILHAKWADTAGQIILENKVHYTQRNILFLSLTSSITPCEVLIVKLEFWMWSMLPAHSAANRKKGVNRTLSPWTSKLCTVPLLPKSTSYLSLDLSGHLLSVLEPVASHKVLLLSCWNRESA